MYINPFEEIRAPYREHYRCLPMGSPSNPNRRSAQENGGKIILPPSALDHLTRLNIDFPMFFKLTYLERSTHCGVLEFTAPEGYCFVPDWVYKHLAISKDNYMIGVEYVNMPVATFVRFQPESSDFFEIYDHKAVLENALRNFACLTQGDQISIKYNDREYQLNILVTEPNIAVSIFECDMRVDFAEPVNGSTKDNSIHDDHDHKKEQSLASKAVKQSHNFPGSGRRLDGKSTPAACASAISQVRGIPDYDYLPNKLTFFRNHNSHIKAEEKFEAKLAGDPFTPFTGKGRTLHG